MNIEQLRAEFETWWATRQSATSIKEDAFAAYQAGRAALQSQDRTAWFNTLERKAEALWTAAREDRHEAMKDLLHHARNGVQSQDRVDVAALRKALQALEAISDEMTVGDRFTNAGQRLLDALEPVRAAIDHARRNKDTP